MVAGTNVPGAVAITLLMAFIAGTVLFPMFRLNGLLRSSPMYLCLPTSFSLTTNYVPSSVGLMLVKSTDHLAGKT